MDAIHHHNGKSHTGKIEENGKRRNLYLTVAVTFCSKPTTSAINCRIRFQSLKEPTAWKAENFLLEINSNSKYIHVPPVHSVYCCEFIQGAFQSTPHWEWNKKFIFFLISSLFFTIGCFFLSYLGRKKCASTALRRKRKVVSYFIFMCCVCKCLVSRACLCFVTWFFPVWKWSLCWVFQLCISFAIQEKKFVLTSKQIALSASVFFLKTDVPVQITCFFHWIFYYYWYHHQFRQFTRKFHIKCVQTILDFVCYMSVPSIFPEILISSTLSTNSARFVYLH